MPIKIEMQWYNACQGYRISTQPSNPLQALQLIQLLRSESGPFVCLMKIK